MGEDVLCVKWFLMISLSVTPLYVTHQMKKIIHTFFLHEYYFPSR